MIKLITVILILFTFTAHGKEFVPFEVDQLPKSQYDDEMQKIAVEVSKYGDSKRDSEIYEKVKKFLAVPRSKKAESLIIDEPVWVYRIKKHPDWFFVFFKVNQVKSKGTYRTFKVTLIKNLNKSFKIYREKDLESTYDLQKSKARTFVEYIAKAAGDQTPERVLSAELKPTKEGFDYLFSLYNGEGIHERRGKLNKEGKILQRELQYLYCSHSMGPENQCYVAKLSQSFDARTGKAIKTEGICQVDYVKDRKNIKKIKITNLESLARASKVENFEGVFKIYFKEPVPKELLVPVNHCMHGKKEC